MIREKNEDSYYVKKINEKDYLFIVADGMGGHSSGDVASNTAIEIISNYIFEKYNAKMSEQELYDLIKSSIRIANSVIFTESKKNENLAGMGTTVVLCLIQNNTAVFANVGDSRAYIIKNNEINKLTIDHSIVEELVINGSITKEEAKTHPHKNIITRALGGDIDIKIDLYYEHINQGDIIILCSDGLSNMLKDDEIMDIVCSNKNNTQEKAEYLVKQANENGGLDNITAIIIEN
jgi:protein phosphatase